jgi:hypothetical protein
MYRFAYYGTIVKTDDKWRPHHLRDAEAFIHLCGPLHQGGYELGGVLLNAPNSNRSTAPALTTDDLIIVTTRPPMHDNPEFDGSWIPRSGSILESRIFELLQGACFVRCKRDFIELTFQVAKALREGVKNRRSIVFRTRSPSGQVHLRCAYLELDHQPLEPESELAGRTAVYAAYFPQLWEKGPQLLLVFGVSEIHTLAFCAFFRKHLPAFVAPLDGTTFRFFMAEMVPVPFGPVRALDDFSFVNQWLVHEPLIHQTFMYQPVPRP